MMVAGTHFTLDADPADVAWKLVAVNLSDLAAKGARPIGVLLGYMLGGDAWDTAFAAGLRHVLARYGVSLWGGDTVAAPSATQARTLGLTAVGQASHSPVPSRGGARPGDRLWVTGLIGEAMAGFGAVDATVGQLDRFHRPTPRIEEGAALAPHVTAMMDVSDGLLLDAQRMALASGVTIDIDPALVPMALPPARRDAGMRWGDDYELLFTLANERAPPCPATLIGLVTKRGAHPLTLAKVPPGEDCTLGYYHGA